MGAYEEFWHDYRKLRGHFLKQEQERLRRSKPRALGAQTVMVQKNLFAKLKRLYHDIAGIDDWAAYIDVSLEYSELVDRAREQFGAVFPTKVRELQRAQEEEFKAEQKNSIRNEIEKIILDVTYDALVEIYDLKLEDVEWYQARHPYIAVREIKKVLEDLVAGYGKKLVDEVVEESAPVTKIEVVRPVPSPTPQPPKVEVFVTTIREEDIEKPALVYRYGKPELPIAPAQFGDPSHFERLKVGRWYALTHFPTIEEAKKYVESRKPPYIGLEAKELEVWRALPAYELDVYYWQGEYWPMFRIIEAPKPEVPLKVVTLPELLWKKIARAPGRDLGYYLRLLRDIEDRRYNGLTGEQISLAIDTIRPIIEELRIEEARKRREPRFGRVETIPGERAPERVPRIEIPPAVEVEVKPVKMVDQVALGRELEVIARERFGIEFRFLSAEQKAEIYPVALERVSKAGKVVSRLPEIEVRLMQMRDKYGRFVFPQEKLYWSLSKEDWEKIYPWTESLPMKVYRAFSEGALDYGDFEEIGIPRWQVDEWLMYAKAEMHRRGSKVVL